MSALSERCEQRKAEAQALAEKYNAGVEEVEKMKNAMQKHKLLLKSTTQVLKKHKS